MSRIGKLPVEVPAGVTITVGDKDITVAGPKGTLTVPVQANTTTKVEGNQIIVTRSDDEPKSRAWHGLQRALINNAVEGVTKGFEKKLEINGVGFRLSGGPKEIEMALEGNIQNNNDDVCRYSEKSKMDTDSHKILLSETRLSEI